MYPEKASSKLDKIEVLSDGGNDGKRTTMSKKSDAGLTFAASGTTNQHQNINDSAEKSYFDQIYMMK